MARLPSADDLAFIGKHALNTPIRSSRGLDEAVGRTIFVKDETVQHSGSFKYRGAILGVRNAETGVVAAGSGNFPIAVGLAARTLNKRACLVMPHDVPAFKLERARATGAEIKFVDRSNLVSIAEAEAIERGWRNLHAFEDIEMITGSYGLGLEIAESIKEAGDGSDAIVVACGGGGLSSGVSLALRSQSIPAAIYVVEPASHQRYAKAREAGVPVRIEPEGTTICDALQSRLIGQRAFDILQQADVIPRATGDGKISQATDLLRQTCDINTEPSGALALAAVLDGSIDPTIDRIWIVACGGNAATGHMARPSLNSERAG